MSSQPSPASDPERKFCHDLKNSLGIIMGHCQLLDTLVSASPEAREHVRVIFQVAQRMADEIRTRQRPPKL